MKFIQGRIRDYSWGSACAIPEFFGYPAADFPVAELWLGAHPTAPSSIIDDDNARVLNIGDLAREKNERPGVELNTYIAQNPTYSLGEDVVKRHGVQLPFLLKVIAPDRPLSLQVHPSKMQALEGFERENELGIDPSAANRCYPDCNHKPELVYALTKFEALVGFRSPRRIMGVLADLDVPLAQKLRGHIVAKPNARGVREAFECLISKDTRPSSDEIRRIVRACARRPAEESSSYRADLIVQRLAQYYPGDPGVVASLLLNPVTLNPGEALFTPAGTVHAYLSGMGVEIMAASDNVLRAGLTPKHVDVGELLRVVNTVAAPPIRIAPEKVTQVQSTYYVPVEDFELSIVTLRDASAVEKLRGAGPRIIVCLRGAVELFACGKKIALNTGQAVFLDAADGKASVRGVGQLVQADVP